MNVITVGLTEQQQNLFTSMQNARNSHVTAFDNGKLAIQEIKKSQQSIDWIIVAGFDEDTQNKELLCAIRSMGISPEILVVNDQFKVNATRPSFCSVQQTDNGPKLLKCAMHTMLAQDRKESSVKSHTSMTVFEYQGKQRVKH